MSKIRDALQVAAMARSKLAVLSCLALAVSIVPPHGAFPVTAEGSAIPQADDAENKEVLAAVQKLFDAMAEGDADKAREVLVIEGQFLSVRPGDGEDTRVIRSQSNETFLQQLAGAVDNHQNQKYPVPGGIQFSATGLDERRNQANDAQ